MAKIKTERNNAIIEDRENGMTWRAIEDKYGISKQSAHFIYLREKNRGVDKSTIDKE